MGFHSRLCRGCGESVKAPYSLPSSLQWQNDAVVLLPTGSLLTGPYDGYGRISLDDLGPPSDATELRVHVSFIGSPAEFWHDRCFTEAGHPAYSGASENAPDQGYVPFGEKQVTR